jgi:hypothetical protein
VEIYKRTGRTRRCSDKNFELGEREKTGRDK